MKQVKKRLCNKLIALRVRVVFKLNPGQKESRGTKKNESEKKEKDRRDRNKAKRNFSEVPFLRKQE